MRFPFLCMAACWLIGCVPVANDSVVREGVVVLNGSTSARHSLLNGAWEFYWQRLLSPREIRADDRQPTGTFGVPGSWGGQSSGATALTGFGFATYRLRVKLNADQSPHDISQEPGAVDPARGQPFALYIHSFNSAFQMYCNQQLCGRSGRPGRDLETERPSRAGVLIDPGPAVDGEWELVLQLSNFHHRNGGIWGDIHFGSRTALQTLLARRQAFDIFLIGSLFIMGIYHLILALLRGPRDRSPLFFGLFCLVVVLRALATMEGTLLGLPSMFSYELGYKLEYLGFYAAIPLGLSFLDALFPGEGDRGVVGLVQVLGGLFCLFVIVTPVRLFSETLFIYELVSVLVVAYGVYILLMATRHRREGARLFLVSFLILGGTFLHDVLAASEITPYFLLAPLGVLVFVFSQAVLLSGRFNTAFATAETLADELEDRVALRTRELESARLEAEAERARADIGRGRVEHLSEFARRLNAASEPQAIIDEIYNYVDHYFAPQLSWLLLVDGERKQFNYCSGGKRTPSDNARRWLESMREVPLDSRAGLVYSVYRKRRFAYFQDVNRLKDRMRELDRDGVRKLDLHDILYIPLVAQEKIVAILGMTGLVPGLVNSVRLYLHLFTEEAAGALQRALLARKDEENEVRLAAIGRMASGIIHDLKNPMAVIKLYAEMSDDESVGRENRRRYLESISREIDRLTEMSLEILDFAGGISHLQHEAIRLSELVGETLDFHAAELIEAGIVVRRELEFEPAVHLDRDRMRRALGNLIANAREALGGRRERLRSGHPGAEIVVGARREESFLLIYVRDNGPGIPEEIRDRVFDSFVTLGKAKGTGLGLSVVRTVAEAHGGGVSFDTGPGGTTFTINIPLDAGRIAPEEIG